MKLISIEELMQKANAIYEAQSIGEDADAGFDGGEFSGPAHDVILQDLIEKLCQENGYSCEELWLAEAELASKMEAAEQHQPHDGMCDLNNAVCRAYVDERIRRGEA